MKLSSSPLSGVYIIQGEAVRDHRGMFQRLFCDQELSDVVGPRNIVQINLSKTMKVGTVRGLHYQRPPFMEMKLVRCLRGRIWDVVVDLRANSPTFLHWHSEELSLENGRMIVIPEGCAHGFQVLEAESELLYLHTEHYKVDGEEGIRYDDILLGIHWPVSVTDVSHRDLNHPLLRSDFCGLSV